MGDLSARVPVKRLVVEAVVHRADGSREDLGAVSYWHRNPLRRLAWRLKQKVGG